jgi:hypothetical protein
MACLNSAIKKGAQGSLLADIDLSTSQQELATAFTTLGLVIHCISSNAAPHPPAHPATNDRECCIQ